MAKLFKFCVVGGINTLITLVIFYVLNKVIGLNYLLSSVVGYVIGMFNSYILNKRWTFRDKDKNLIPQFIRFSIVNILSLCINLLAMFILVDKLRLDSMLSQIIATGFSTISNYIGSRFLVFRYSRVKEQFG